MKTVALLFVLLALCLVGVFMVVKTDRPRILPEQDAFSQELSELHYRHVHDSEPLREQIKGAKKAGNHTEADRLQAELTELIEVTQHREWLEVWRRHGRTPPP